MSTEADLSALEARDRLLHGNLGAVDLTDALLEKIVEREPAIGAFVTLGADLVRVRARMLDDLRKSGAPSGPLHGLSVGVKDIIDTADMPTGNGTEIDAGRLPEKDATVVSRLRATGAIVIGKTVTTELAYFHPGATRNPRNRDHTPGGSSSGSAAAVAAGMIPLAIGTQTNGSVIRPASFCGVVGYKPTHGLVPRTGILHHSPALDTVGVFARTLADAALLVEAIAGEDPLDADTIGAVPPQLLNAVLGAPDKAPVLGFARTPFWESAAGETRQGIEGLVSRLGEACTEVALPAIFANAPAAQRTLMVAGFAKNLRPYYDRGRDRLSETLRAAIEEGQRVPATDYLDALGLRDALNEALDPLFDRFDALVTPAAPGEAPYGLQSTGNPVFNGLWTLCGVPAVSLPLLEGTNGLPIGVQLIGRRGEDARLLKAARWLTGTVAAGRP